MIRFLKFKPLYLSLLLCLSVYAFFYKSLLLNITTHLSDWNDYPFYVWTIYQYIDHFRSLDFNGFFNANIYSPYQGTMLFSDLLLPSSIIAFVFSFFSNNPILVFNLTLVTALILNVLSTHFFWSGVFKKTNQVVFATFLTCVSAFTFQNHVHFQILSFWPFFFTIGVFIRNKLDTKNAVLTGFLLALQFLNGVYLAVFFLFVAGFWYLIRLIVDWKNKTLVKKLLLHGTIMITVFFIFAGPFLLKYFQVQKSYNMTREYWEYIYYAAHASDYLFSTNYQSVISQTWPISKWNSINRAGSLYPGIVLVALPIIYLFYIQKKKSHFSFGMQLTSSQDTFFFVLAIFGFFASLGPKLSINGVYTGLPMPYDFFLRFIPLVEPVRSNSRWYLLLLIALIYFSMKELEKRQLLSKKIILGLLVVLPILELVPIAKKTEAKNYYHPPYELIAQQCQTDPKVLLEYPMTQDTKDINIVTNLTYRTQQMLATIHHRCNIVNGYMGYSPKDYDRYEMVITDAVNLKKSEVFWKLLQEKNISYLKLNKRDLFEEKVNNVIDLMKKENVKKVYEDEYFILFSIGI